MIFKFNFSIPSRMFSTECVRANGFRKQYLISWKPFISWQLTLDLDNFRFIEVDFVAVGGFLLITHVGFRKFWWISWISIFRPTVRSPLLLLGLPSRYWMDLEPLP